MRRCFGCGNELLRGWGLPLCLRCGRLRNEREAERTAAARLAALRMLYWRKGGGEPLV